MRKQWIATTAGVLALASTQAQISSPSSSGAISSPAKGAGANLGISTTPLQPRTAPSPGSITPNPATTTQPTRPNDFSRLNPSTSGSAIPSVRGPNSSLSTINSGLTDPSIPAPEPNNGFRTSPAPGIDSTPTTGVGTPNATAGALDPFATPIQNPATRLDDYPNSGFGTAPAGEAGTGAGRITTPRPLGGTGSTSPFDTSAEQSQGFDRSGLVRPGLNDTGVSNPARMREQPLDRALSAKLRADLSQISGARASSQIAPETVSDLRISSQNGRVSLEGFVNNQLERDIIETRARSMQGVVLIENRLQIRQPTQNLPANRSGLGAQEAISNPGSPRVGAQESLSAPAGTTSPNGTSPNPVTSTPPVLPQTP